MSSRPKAAIESASSKQAAPPKSCKPWAGRHCKVGAGTMSAQCQHNDEKRPCGTCKVSANNRFTSPTRASPGFVRIGISCNIQV